MPNSIVDLTSRWVPAEAEGFRAPERHAGDIRRAQELVDELGKKYPANSWLNTVTLPAARAAAEMRQGHHAHAVELPQPAAHIHPS